MCDWVEYRLRRCLFVAISAYHILADMAEDVVAHLLGSVAAGPAVVSSSSARTSLLTVMHSGQANDGDQRQEPMRNLV
jgi:hypothetical protein